MELLRVLTDRYGLAAAAKFMHLSASIYCPEQLTP
ncbi:hypothetical protein Gbro_1165 [Gordonia bronchialis DSM 43247]|uniref:Uncharacterized protein n=2 Tax=Gordonia bronchialis TaxID=2054 RepID=D0L521_GORB4|nr:hypothetical protein Gbro_1165 [Gordonia bronchialis DSM 43247]